MLNLLQYFLQVLLLDSLLSVIFTPTLCLCAALQLALQLLDDFFVLENLVLKTVDLFILLTDGGLQCITLAGLLTDCGLQ